MSNNLPISAINWLECIWKTDLPPNSKYLAAYIRTYMNSKHDVAWPSYARITYETGLSKSTVAKYFDILEKAGWILRERGSSNSNTRYIVNIPKNVVSAISQGSAGDGLGSAPHGLRSAGDGLHVVRHTDTNKQVNKQIRERFTPPSVEEVKKYCHERGNYIDPEQFVNFYASKGWKVGSNPMKDWKAAVITWEKRNKASNGHLSSEGELWS